jgi:hypothetical protein
MPIVASDPLTWTMSSLGWAFIGVCCILIGTVIVRVIGELLGGKEGRRWRPLLLAELVYMVVVSVVNTIAYVGSHPYWTGIAISYAPLVVAPMVALLGALAWPREVQMR